MARWASDLATDRLRFLSDIAAEAAAWLGAIICSNGALQYTPNPPTLLEALCGLKASQTNWQRVLFLNSGAEQEMQSSFIGDDGPGTLPVGKERIVKYVRTNIPEASFLSAHDGLAIAEAVFGELPWER